MLLPERELVLRNAWDDNFFSLFLPPLVHYMKDMNGLSSRLLKTTPK